MQVRKRNGSFEPVNLDKVVNSIRRVCEDLGPDVDIYKVATKTVGGLVDSVSTREIDLLSIRNAVGLISEDPSYSKVAGRILANVISKEVGNQDIQSFSQSIEIGYREGLICARTHDLAMANKRKLNDRIRHERDWLFEFHGIQTLYDRYLLKHPTATVENSKQRVVIETPQYFLMRVACGLANDAQEAVELYDLLSSLEYMASTPTLFNAGTRHSQMSSCYLLDSPLDALDDIYKRYGDIAMLSKFAGGIGVSATRIRGKGSLIRGTNGKSNGIVPWLHTLSGSVAAVNQGGKRKGAAAVYLEPHHPDIMDFLELRDNTGEKERRAYNLNLANWVSDLFMQRVRDDAMWSLIDPTVAPELTDLYGDAYEARYKALEAEGKVAEQIPARKVYARMMRTLAETGNGWMCFKDTSNKRGNQVGDDRIIHLSNLCVAPETLLLTREGHVPISDLKDQTVEVWNGSEWSETVVRQTGTDQVLMTITLDNGLRLDTTPYHKFYKVVGSKVVEVRAADLKDGDRLIKHDLPVIDGSMRFEEAYTHGFFCGDGTYTSSGKPWVSIAPPKEEVISHLAVTSGTGVMTANSRLNYRLDARIPQKFVVPSAQHTVIDRLEWFAGLADADGTVTNNHGCLSIQIGSINLGFLRDVLLMLQTLGVHARVQKMRDVGAVRIRASEKEYPTKPMYRLLIASAGVNTLLDLGLTCRRLKLSKGAPNRDARHFVRVVGVAETGRRDDTFCVTEPKRHMAMFNGVLTGNCTEILEVTSAGKRATIGRNHMQVLTADEMVKDSIRITGFNTATDSFDALTGAEVAVCNLGSINIGRGYIKNGKLDKAKLRRNVAIAVKYLDRVIDRNYYPVPEAHASNMRWRPVGLGLMGLADFFMQMRVPFESEEAIRLSGEIQEEIYYQAVKTSCELAQQYGTHRDFHLTRAASGDLQFDLAGVAPKDKARWDALREEVKRGMRNSLLIAIAPTATISHICGVEECIEPIKSNLLKRETLSGEFIGVNRYLVEDLKKAGVWNDDTRRILVRDEGSVSNIPNVAPELKALYKTVWEMSMKPLIAHAATRGSFIDQSQSVNFFIDLNKYPEERRTGVLSSLYMTAWESGLKTTYYFRSRSATRIEKTTIAPQGAAASVTSTVPMQAVMAPEESEVCESCT